MFARIIATALLSIYFMEFMKIPSKKIFGYRVFNRKPFNCEYCLPVYVSALLWLLPTYCIEFICATLGAGLLTTIYFKIYAKWMQ